MSHVKRKAVMCKLKAATSWPIQFSILTVSRTIYNVHASKVKKQEQSFRNSLEWLIYIHNSIDKITFSCNTPHQCSTSVSLETYIAPLYSLFDQESVFFCRGRSHEDWWPVDSHHACPSCFPLLACKGHCHFQTIMCSGSKEALCLM